MNEEVKSPEVMTGGEPQKKISPALKKELKNEAKKYPSKLFREYIEQICQKADGIILYASMVVVDIRKKKISLE